MALLFESVNSMNKATPTTTFRGLPLTDGQESEIRHYIHLKERNHAPWDTAELQAMLADMLTPPELADDDDDDVRASGDSMAAERAIAEGEEPFGTDPQHGRLAS
jgi:hypothetical protein